MADRVSDPRTSAPALQSGTPRPGSLAQAARLRGREPGLTRDHPLTSVPGLAQMSTYKVTKELLPRPACGWLKNGFCKGVSHCPDPQLL